VVFFCLSPRFPYRSAVSPPQTTWPPSAILDDVTSGPSSLPVEPTLLCPYRSAVSPPQTTWPPSAILDDVTSGSFSLPLNFDPWRVMWPSLDHSEPRKFKGVCMQINQDHFTIWAYITTHTHRHKLRMCCWKNRLPSLLKPCTTTSICYLLTLNSPLQNQLGVWDQIQNKGEINKLQRDGPSRKRACQNHQPPNIAKIPYKGLCFEKLVPPNHIQKEAIYSVFYYLTVSKLGRIAIFKSLCQKRNLILINQLILKTRSQSFFIVSKGVNSNFIT